MTTASPAWGVLRHRDFRWFYIAQFISLIGSSMQLAAVNWHVWTLTRDELALGLVGLVRVLPIIAFALAGGVIADSFDRRKLQIITQTGMFIAAAAMGIATLTGQASLPIIYGATALIAGMVAFDQPARRAMMVALVPPERIGDVGRVNVILFTVTSVLGPAIAGAALAQFGPGIAYLLNGLSFLPVVLVLFFVRPRPSDTPASRPSFGAMVEGLRFVWGQPVLRATMLLDFLATFFSSALTLLPVYATDVLKVDELGYGILFAAPAIGAAIGSVAMAQIGSRLKQPGRVMLWAVGGYGAATVLFGFSSVFAFSMLALALTGLMDAISTGIRSPMRDLLTPDHMRGRTIGVNMIFFMGGPQLGEFEAGVMARAFGAPFSVISGGLATIFITGLIALKVPALQTYREQATH